MSLYLHQNNKVGLIEYISVSELERSLFQFVALALPAVAILLQAMISFQEKLSTVESEIAFRREFRVIEFSLFFLVAAGVALSFSLFQSANSDVTKFSISLLLISLISLGFGTWLAFGRARYPTKFFDSPESMIKSTLTISIPILVIFALLYVFREQIYTIENIGPRSLLITFFVSNFLLIVYQIYNSYSSKKRLREQIDTWIEIKTKFVDMIENIEDNLVNGGGDMSISSSENYERRVKDAKNLLMQLKNKKPPNIQEMGISNSFSQIERAISRISETIDELIILQKELEQKKTERVEKTDKLENTRERIDEIESRLEEIDDELPEGAFSDFKEPYVSDFKLDALSAERSKLRGEKSEIESTTVSLENDTNELSLRIKNIKEKMDKNETKIKEAVNTIEEEINKAEDTVRKKRPDLGLMARLT